MTLGSYMRNSLQRKGLAEEGSTTLRGDVARADVSTTEGKEEKKPGIRLLFWLGGRCVKNLYVWIVDIRKHAREIHEMLWNKVLRLKLTKVVKIDTKLSRPSSWLEINVGTSATSRRDSHPAHDNHSPEIVAKALFELLEGEGFGCSPNK